MTLLMQSINNMYHYVLRTAKKNRVKLHSLKTFELIIQQFWNLALPLYLIRDRSHGVLYQYCNTKLLFP
jgi:hypothetical protein